MEKKEVRIKCIKCGTGYKLKVPVTDKPVTFKCRQCGKVLRLRIKSASPIAAPSPAPGQPAIGRPEQHETPGPGQSVARANFVEDYFSEADRQPAPSTPESGWFCLSGDLVRGPFTGDQIRTMINKREVQEDTPLRMGGRPWYAAGKIGDFRELFREEVRTGARVHPDVTDQSPEEDSAETDSPGGSGNLFYENIPDVFPYPIRAGVWQPLVIFAGIAFVLSAVLCLHLTLGLVVNLLGWPILYGYLTSVMQRSISSPDNPPPEWNFAAVQDMLLSGTKIFAILLLSSVVPSGLLLMAGVTFFLNSMQTMGNVSILLACVVFAGSLLVAPAALVIFVTSGDLGRALNPSAVIAIIRKGGRPYAMLAVFSFAAGVACLLVAVLGVLVLDSAPAGFLVGGLLMAAVFSYGHFVWFHVLGRFAGENRRLITPAVSPV